MTGDMGDMWNDLRNDRKEKREKYGVECPIYIVIRPKAYPSILLPGQGCKIDGYISPRILREKIDRDK